MINVEAEVSKYQNCKDRDEIVRAINEYKGLAMQNAHDMTLAGRYNMVALKLQEICDKFPVPKIKGIPSRGPGPQTKTANFNKEEKARINADWRKKTSGKKDDKK